MSKLKVSSYRSSVGEKRRAIIKVLAFFPEGATPKTIARETRLNVNTVKSILKTLPGIKKVMRGLYKVAEGGDGSVARPSSPLVSWNFHNCILSAVLQRHPHRLTESSASFGLIGVSLVISPFGNATFRLQTDYPLNVSSLSLASALFRLMLKEHSPDVLSDEKILIKTIEFNKDFSNLRLDGVRCITLDSLATHFKAYQKSIGLRIEHKTKIPFAVENVVDMLSQNPNSLDMHLKLSSQKDQLNHLLVVTKRNTELLFKVIDRLSRGADQ